MLQIISGKFFDDNGCAINEREEDAVLHSNYAWIGGIRTSVAEMRPVDYACTPIATYTVRYVSRYQPTENDILVQPHSRLVVDQLRLLATLWFRAFFHEDLSYTEAICRAHPRHTSGELVPRQFVRDFFDVPKRGTSEEVERFVAFVDKVIGMPRCKFKAFMASASIFVDALESLSANFDLAYSMFVYLLEALSHSTTAYVPQWSDYDQNVRLHLDPLLQRIDQDIAHQVRDVLLDGAQLKLTKRFKTFVAEHVEDSFFIEEAAALERAIPKSELDQALGNLYKTRSGFVHELRTVHEQLRLPNVGNSSDIFTWHNDTFLTMSGLVRLAHHVLLTFVRRAPVLTREQYAWRRELPGIISAEMAAQYWVWRTDGFTPNKAQQRLGGLIELIVAERCKEHPELPNLRPLMTEIESLVHQANQSDRQALVAIYYTYNRAMTEECRQQGYEDFLQRHNGDVATCHIGLLAADFVLDAIPFRWPVDNCVRAFEDYQRTKFRATWFRLPVLLEVAIVCELANMHLSEGMADDYQKWALRAVHDLGGHRELQAKVAQYMSRRAPIPALEILGKRPVLPVQPDAADAVGE